MPLAMKCQINNGGYLELRSFTFSALHDLYSATFYTLLADACPQVVILTQLPFAVEMLAQIWAK